MGSCACNFDQSGENRSEKKDPCKKQQQLRMKELQTLKQIHMNWCDLVGVVR